MTSKSNRWGVKFFVLATSIAGTLGGWAVLASNQVAQANALQPGTARGELSQPAARQQTLPTAQANQNPSRQSSPQPTQIAPRQQTVPTPQTNLRQAPSTTFQPRARTRSSR